MRRDEEAACVVLTTENMLGRRDDAGEAAHLLAFGGGKRSAPAFVGRGGDVGMMR